MARTCLPPSQVAFQQSTEALSLLVAVPVLGYAALKAPELPLWARWALGGLAVAHLLNDGLLLATWKR